MARAEKSAITDTIIRLLYQHDRVIIPGLGAIVCSAREASIHPVSHTFRPASKELSFDPSDLDNDKVLENQVALDNHVTQAWAREKVRKFTSALKEELDEGKGAVLPGIGIFSLNTRNEIQFIPEQGPNFLASSYGLEEFSSLPIQRTGPVPLPDPAPPVVPEKEKEVIAATPSAPVPERTEPQEETAPEQEDPSPALAGTEKKKSRTAAFLWFIIPLLGLVFIAWFWWPHWEMVWDMATGKNGKTELKTPDQALNPEPSSIGPASPDQDLSSSQGEEVLPESGTETDAAAVELQESQASTKKYYIIAGCFRSEKNANKLLEELQAASYPASIQGKTPKGLYRVCYRGFSDFTQAKKELQRILREENTGAWLINLENDPN